MNIAITASFALIISVYMSLSTESLGHQARTLVCAYLKPAHAAGVLKFCRLFRQSFANFLTGQCSEAVILGVLMALAFSVFKIPYGSLVGVLTAICAIIPYVGALISCVVSVFLVLLVDPVLAVRCLIVYLAVQFVENQFIYPRVVGKSAGLSPFLANPTTDGVVLFPSALAITTGSPPSRTATHEFVVPKSIPITFPILFSSSIYDFES